jgi:tetratricopeptide (TPR) repeat protein
MLARADRKVRHLAAARHFEALGLDELAGALAGHYLAAYSNAGGGPERDALAGQARIALRAAAERAAALGAHEQALRFYDQALTVASDPADEAALHEDAGKSAAVIPRMDDAERHFSAAIEGWAAIGDRPGQARVAAAHASALLGVYRFDAALAILTDAAEGFADLPEDPAVVTLNGQLARAYFLLEENIKAVAVADRVLAVAELADLVEVVADTLVTRGSALANQGRRYEGIGAIEAGQRLAAANSLHRIVRRALTNLASFLMDVDPRAALEAAREGIELGRRLGERTFQIEDVAVVGALRIGEWDWAAAELEPMLGEDIDPAIRAVALADAISLRACRDEPTDQLLADVDALPAREGDVVKAATSAWARGWIAFADGRFDVARREFLRFVEVFNPGTVEGSLAAARCDLLARAPELAREDLARAEGSPRRGRAVDADRATIRAGIAALEGRSSDALAGYREVLGVWRDLGLVWDEALCAIEMATLLDPSEPEVASAADAARRTLARLGAKPFLARLDAALARTTARVASSYELAEAASVNAIAKAP